MISETHQRTYLADKTQELFVDVPDPQRQKRDNVLRIHSEPSGRCHPGPSKVISFHPLKYSIHVISSMEMDVLKLDNRVGSLEQAQSLHASASPIRSVRCFCGSLGLHCFFETVNKN